MSFCSNTTDSNWAATRVGPQNKTLNLSTIRSVRNDWSGGVEQWLGQRQRQVLGQRQYVELLLLPRLMQLQVWSLCRLNSEFQQWEVVRSTRMIYSAGHLSTLLPYPTSPPSCFHFHDPHIMQFSSFPTRGADWQAHFSPGTSKWWQWKMNLVATVQETIINKYRSL